jgi:hypothetical protein
LIDNSSPSQNCSDNLSPSVGYQIIAIARPDADIYSLENVKNINMFYRHYPRLMMLPSFDEQLEVINKNEME